MADEVATHVITDTAGYYAVHLVNVSDSTGETGVVKVDKSALTGPNGEEPASLDLCVARWNVQGFSSVNLYWNHTAPDLMLAMSGSGFEDFLSSGPSPEKIPDGAKDPRSEGGTGDVTLDTIGASATATYDITLWFRKNPA